MRGGDSPTKKTLPGGLGRWAGCNFCHCSTPKKLFFGGRDSPSNTPLRPAVTVKLHSGPKNKLKSVFPLLYFLLENGLGGESWQKCLLRDGFTERWWRKKQWWLPPIFLSPFFLPKRVLCVCAFFLVSATLFTNAAAVMLFCLRGGREGALFKPYRIWILCCCLRRIRFFRLEGEKQETFMTLKKREIKCRRRRRRRRIHPPFSLATSQFTYGERK